MKTNEGKLVDVQACNRCLKKIMDTDRWLEKKVLLKCEPFYMHHIQDIDYATW